MLIRPYLLPCSPPDMSKTSVCLLARSDKGHSLDTRVLIEKKHQKKLLTPSFLLNLAYVGHCEKDDCVCAGCGGHSFHVPRRIMCRGTVKQKGHQKCHQRWDWQVTLLVNATCNSALSLFNFWFSPVVIIPLCSV